MTALHLTESNRQAFARDLRAIIAAADYLGQHARDVEEQQSAASIAARARKLAAQLAPKEIAR